MAPSEVVLSVAVLALLVAPILGLRRNAPWGRWAGLVVAVVGLFFLLPVTGTILFGSVLEPVGSGWDAVFFPATTGALVALLAMLVSMWRETSPRGAN